MESQLLEPNALRQRVVDKVDALREEILSTSRYLYEHPELSGQEYESSKLLSSRAQKAGFHVEHGLAGLETSFRARLKPELAGPRVAFLAEYDALPGVGHGCGHNMIGTASTFAAVALAEVARQLPGDVALYGTPAEETDGGKITMLEAGAFEGVDAAMMMHPGLDTEFDYATLACTCIIVEFFGRTAHASSSPWKGANALDAMIQLFVSVDLMRKQLPPTARTPGIITHGGERANMVPEYARGEFSLRGKDKEEAEYVLERVLECARAAAQATHTRFEYQMDGNVYYDMRTDPTLARLFAHAWDELGGEKPDTTPKSHGSVDIGNLSHRFPCLHAAVRITDDRKIAAHSREFAQATITDFAQEQLVRATKTLALTGLDVLLTHRD